MAVAQPVTVYTTINARIANHLERCIAASAASSTLSSSILGTALKLAFRVHMCSARIVSCNAGKYDSTGTWKTSKVCFHENVVF